MRKKIAFALIMGSLTTGIISFTLIFVNLGFTERFFSVWIKSWVMSYVVVIPAILFIGPRVQMLVDKLFKDIIAEEE